MKGVPGTFRACWLMAFLLVLLLPGSGAQGGQKDAAVHEYVLQIARDPDRRWFECKRVPASSGFVTDPDVAAYYPYRFSRGQEHYAIVQPTECVPEGWLYWLEVERRYLKVLEEAKGALGTCRVLLPEIERTVRRQHRSRRQLERRKPRWERALLEAKALYLERVGETGAGPEDLDVLKLWDELTARKQELLAAQPQAGGEPHEAPPAAPEMPPPAQLPRIEYLVAEPTPNCGGGLITLRWPVSPLDPAPARPASAVQAAAAQAYVPPPRRELTAHEKAELEEIDRKLRALRPAHKYASFLRDADARSRGFRQQLAHLRGEYLKNAAKFSAAYTCLLAESRHHLGAALGVEPGAVTPQLVADRKGRLSAGLEEARIKAESPDATAADYDRYDGLRYALRLAEHYLDLSNAGISLEKVENALLWRLARSLEQAELPEQEEAPAGEGAADLAAALRAWAQAGAALETDGSGEAYERWKEAKDALDVSKEESVWGRWVRARAQQLSARLAQARYDPPARPYLRSELTRLTTIGSLVEKRMKQIEREHAARRYYFRLGAAAPGEEPAVFAPRAASASAEPALFDLSKLTNLVFALVFTGTVLFMISYVRRHPDVFVRRIAGLEAVDEAIGRATEMGKPALFVHGLTGVSDVAVLASLSILSRIARRIADYESDLLVANNDPIVYSVSYEVVQEGYTAAGRPDAFKANNVFMAASRQFPYVAAVAGMMARRRPAANFFMGYFFAESLILAEAGSMSGAIQIAATDSFTQIPFFITTCDYTLIGEELYAASAYLSREPKMLGTIKAQDVGKSILLVALLLGTALGAVGITVLQIIFTAYEKAG